MSTGTHTGHEIQALRFEDGALFLLDQRALPDEERWIRCETPERRGGRIRRWPCAARRRSGSPPRTAWRSPTTARPRPPSCCARRGRPR